MNAKTIGQTCRTPCRKPWLLERAERFPEAVCIWWQGRPTTFSEMAERAERLAGRLADAGIGPGDRVALLAPPSLGLVEVFHAVHRLAAVLVPLPPKATAPELARMLDCALPRLLVVAENLRTKADNAVVSCPHKPILMAADFSATLDTDNAGTDSGSRKIALESDLPDARMDAEAIHSIVFTSGTAGAGKGVLLTNANHEASARASAQRLTVGTNDRWLACMPLHHVGGISILVRNAITGVPVILHSGFDAGAVDGTLREEGVTIVSLVPTMLARLLDEARGRTYPPELRVVLTGGGPLGADLAARAHQLGLPIVPTYGLTEAASQVCTAQPSRTAEPSQSSVEPDGAGLAADYLALDKSVPGWTGLPLDGTTIEIADAGDAGVGEIVVQGPTVMAGYFGDAETTRAVLRNGRLYTGDLGRLCADGSLVIECRRTDLIVSGGENIYPGEVEAVLNAHAEVAEAVVYGLPDSKWGQSLHAAVVLRDPSPTPGKAGDVEIEHRLRQHCSETLASFKVPRRFRFVVELPHTASGKVACEDLARTYEQESANTGAKGDR